MGKINKEWHLSHRMPKNPTPPQRLEWHLEHAQVCQCREPSEEIRRLLAQRQQERGQ